jgi:CRISPR type III-A-associated RAMP protein Csm5
VRVLSLNLKNSLDWKKFKVYIETLTPVKNFSEININNGIKLKGTIKIDNYLLEDSKILKERLGYTDQIKVIKNFSNLCNKYSNDRINREINFFNECDLKELADWYKKIKGLKLKENQFLLQIGWGTGFESKTVFHCFPEDSENLRQAFGLGKKKVRIHIQCDGEVLSSFNKKGTYFCSNCKRDNLDSTETLLIPFPKTRRIVFIKGKPVYPMGWILVSLEKTGCNQDISHSKV